MSHIELLKEHDLKATPQRLCILDVLHECGHASLEDIQSHTKENFPTLSLSTIYRNINEMVAKGVVSEVKIKNMKERFELSKHQHAHMICIKCGKIEDIHVDTSDLEQRVQTQSGLDVLNATVSFDTVCKECKNS